MPYVNSGRTRLYWEAHGQGPPVLLIMGLSFTCEMWFRLLPALSQSYRTVLFDNRGIGKSDIPRGPYAIQTMADDAAAVLDAAGLPAAHVVGASMGGMIAQELALSHPERVLSLALGCTTFSGVWGKWPRFRRAPLGFAWFRSDRIARERALRPILYSQHTGQDRVDEDIRVRMACRSTLRGVLNQLGGILLWSSYRRLPRIRVPTLVLHGEEDHLLPPANGRIVAERIPGARFLLLPDAGHMLTTDQPEITLHYLMRFLDEVSSGSQPVSTRR